jgi:hypothetical protein
MYKIIKSLKLSSIWSQCIFGSGSDSVGSGPEPDLDCTIREVDFKVFIFVQVDLKPKRKSKIKLLKMFFCILSGLLLNRLLDLGLKNGQKVTL